MLNREAQSLSDQENQSPAAEVCYSLHSDMPMHNGASITVHLIVSFASMST